MSSPPKPPTRIETFNANAVHYEATIGRATKEVAICIVDLPQLESIYSKSAVFLDNACGTAIMAQELVRHCREIGKPVPQIYAVDPAPNMVNIARTRLSNLGVSDKSNISIMPAEKLDFADETFTHSITNLGILFFDDASTGVKEIYRTLKPGGTAIVTSWSDLSSLNNIIANGRKVVRPEAEPMEPSIPDVWFSSDYVQQCLKGDGGFEDVQMLKRQIRYGAADVNGVQQMVLGQYRYVWKDWPEVDQARFFDAVQEGVKKVVEKHIFSDGTVGVGIPLEAMIAVCRK